MPASPERCAHWEAAKVRGGGYCAAHADTVSLGLCRGCKLNTAPGEWPPTLLERARIGDKVEAVASALGIKPCGGCRKRKEFLNHGWTRMGTDGESRWRFGRLKVWKVEGSNVERIGKRAWDVEKRDQAPALQRKPVEG